MLQDMDAEALARDLLRALRGRRSQRALSRRLGFRTNVAYTWESGRRWPTAAEALRVAALNGVDLPGAFSGFLGHRPDWVEGDDPSRVSAFLREIRGGATTSALARRSGRSRYALMRWLDGRAEPRLPDFLAVVEAASLRVLDFVARLVDPRVLPSVSTEWTRLEARRNLAWELPWSNAVLRVIELADYAALPSHRPGFVAARLGIEAAEEARCLEVLERAGLVRWNGLRYAVDPDIAVDTRAAPEEGRRALRAHWARVGCERIEAAAPGQFSYNVFNVSRVDLERLRELHLAYFRQLRTIVAASSPAECVAVANVQLFELASLEGPNKGAFAR